MLCHMFCGLSQLWKHSGWSVIEWRSEHATERRMCSLRLCFLIWNWHSTASGCDLLICEVPQVSVWASSNRFFSAQCDLAKDKCAEYSLTVTAQFIYGVAFNYVFHSTKYVQFLFVFLPWRQSVHKQFFFSLN